MKQKNQKNIKNIKKVLDIHFDHLYDKNKVLS